MEIYRKGECSRFQASTCVANELDQCREVSDKEKGKDFDTYLAEINSITAIQDDSEERSLTSLPIGSSNPASHGAEHQPTRKRIRDEVENLLDQVSGELDRDDDEPQLGLESVGKRAKEEDMPWFDSSNNSNRRTSCVETCQTLLKFSEDLLGVKSLLRVAKDLPEGIPSSQCNGAESSKVSQLISTRSSPPCTLSSLMKRERDAWATLKSYLPQQNLNVKSSLEWSGPWLSEGWRKRSFSSSPTEGRNYTSMQTTSKASFQPSTPMPTRRLSFMTN